MARKIGFSSSKGGRRKGDGPKISVADRYVDKDRARSPHAQREIDQKQAIKTKRQWFPIIFIFFWLIGWSGGLFLVAATLFAGQGDWFIWVWLIFASLGWMLGIYSLIRLLRGAPLPHKKSL